MKRELINTIIINEANFDYIAKTKIINGTLLTEIERVMDTYAQQVSDEKYQYLAKQKLHLLDENDKLLQRLIDAGLEQPAVKQDYQKNA